MVFEAATLCDCYIFENHEYNNNRTEIQKHECVNGGQYGNII